MKEFSNIVVSQKEDMVCLTFDADSFKNANSYRSSYNIPENERLLVYADSNRCTDTLTGTGTFITDEAIYVHPSNRLRCEDGRIPLSKICNFIVCENNRKEVKLFGAQKEFQIYTSTKRGMTSTPAELVKLLKSFQDSLIINPDKRREFIHNIKEIYSVIRRELGRNGVLNEEYINLLAIMEDVPFIRQEAILLQLESEYRRCSKEGYRAFLDAKSAKLSEETIKVLENPDDLFYIGFLNDLSDKDSFFDVKAIIDAYLNLKSLPKLSLCETSILSHLCVRMEDYGYMSELLAEAGDDMEEAKLWRLFSFMSKYKNGKMHSIQAKIAAKSEVLESEYLQTNDLGLCSIHYLLILKNKELLEHILPVCDWTKVASPFPKDRMVDAMYDPMFLAVMSFQEEAFLRKIFAYTSPKASAINRSIRRLDSMIDINMALRKKYPDHKQEYVEKLEEFRAVRRDLKEELKKLAKSEVRRQRQMVKIIKDAGHPFCDFLLDLFSSSAALCDWLNIHGDKRRMNRYKGLFFASKPGVDIGLSFYEWTGRNLTDTKVSDKDMGYTGRKPREDNERLRSLRTYDNPSFRAAANEERKRREEKEKRKAEFRERVANPAPCRGSWFTLEARRDIRKLKGEYRMLVKKYHPDSSGSENTAKILMRIMNERADILDQMAKKP